jgi:hypothetical protein
LAVLVVLAIVVVAALRDDPTASDVEPGATGGASTSVADAAGGPGGGAPSGAGSATTALPTAPSSGQSVAARGPTIEAGGDLAFQPSPAGSPTTASGLSASFELAFTAQAATVRVTWPAQDSPAFDHYVVLRGAPGSQPGELAVAELDDPATVSFSEDLAVAVAPGTPTITYRVAVVDAAGTTTRVSTTLTLQLGWPP